MIYLANTKMTIKNLSNLQQRIKQAKKSTTQMSKTYRWLYFMPWVSAYEALDLILCHD